MSSDPALEAFRTLDVRVGTILSADPLTGARVPAYKIAVDLGSALGTRQSSAQVTKHYAPDDLVGIQVLCVVNFPPKRIAGFSSEVLILGLPDASGDVVLIRPERAVPNGGRLF